MFLSLAFAASSGAFASEFKPGEVIVKYKEGRLRTRSEVNNLYTSVGVKRVLHYSGMMTGFEHLILEGDVSVENAIIQLKKNSSIAYVQPNYILHVYPVSGDADDLEGPENPGPGSVPCWVGGIAFPPGCVSDGPTPSERPELKGPPDEVLPLVADPDLSKAYGLSKIGAIEAWNLPSRGSKVIVADIDTGIDYNHEDLAFNIWRNPSPTDKNDVVGFDFVHNDGLPFDDNKHGTHTAGTIGAVGDNGIGVSGVSPRVTLMALKFLSGEGSGTTADAIRAIDYAISHGAKILSNSWGGAIDQDNQALYDAIERAKAKDVLFVAAAGNDGSDNDGSMPVYPASFKNNNLIVVAATDQNDHLAAFSNYGKLTTHLAAPGANIYSTVPGSKYAVLSGTSMACPHVAGAAALLWSKHPTWNYQKIKDVLLKTVDPLTDLSHKTVSGGRLNILKALNVPD